jgi:hypothetical protein
VDETDPLAMSQCSENKSKDCSAAQCQMIRTDSPQDQRQIFYRRESQLDVERLDEAHPLGQKPPAELPGYFSVLGTSVSGSNLASKSASSLKEVLRCPWRVYDARAPRGQQAARPAGE